jgi:uncharacterized membrane protein YgcG
MAADNSDGYVISEYIKDITIDTKNTYTVTETLKVNFKTPSHGIYLSIPYIHEMVWDELGPRPVLEKTDIVDVSVKGDMYSAGLQDNNYVIKIGNPYITLVGEKVYVISYKQKFGRDKLDTRDLVYYNIIGTKWDTVIENVSFKIHMPKEFDPTQLWFYAGRLGQTGDAPVDYVIEGNTISGTLAGKLGPGEALTLQIDLPQGYFEPPKEFDWKGLLINLAVGLDAAALLLFLMFGLNRALDRSYDYSPPDAISPAEAGYIIENTINDGDVVSLILYWATKGYLSIEQLDEDDFRITRLKNLSSGHRDYEIYMFNELFPSSEPVTLSQLQTKFYVVISDTKDLIKKYYSKKENRFYYPASITLGKILSFIPALLIFSSLLLGIYENTFVLLIAAVISVVCSAVIMLPLVILMKTIRRWNRLHSAARRARLIISVVSSVALLGGYAFTMSYFRLQTLGLVVAGSALFISIISAFMRKRTKLGNELLSRMLGLKGFMENSDKGALEGIVATSPYYFYNVMPYALVFGLADIWSRKFRGIPVMHPQWYTGSYLGSFLFSPFAMQRALHSAFLRFRAPVAKSQAISGVSNIPRGGGGAGGGGSAGSGFGGGGGGRW